MWPWFHTPWAAALQRSLCLEPGKLQVLPVPPCVTVLKHLKSSLLGSLLLSQSGFKMVVIIQGILRQQNALSRG